jgi:DNA invertase Pin-like site-specific DNA recombinase
MNNGQSQKPGKQAKYTAMYVRLSKDDPNDSGESNSITNQKSLLENYAKQNSFTNLLTFQDDGWSGTNFQRPGWQEMMTLVDEGKIETVLLKTMDRMGRDYLRVGLYLEQFKDMGIRVIAVGDSVDTSKGDDDFVPLRNLFAEWYARDTSRKVKAILHNKGKNGKPLAGNPPYGYKKDPADKNHWIVDDEAAIIVRRIFQMCINGMGASQIARTLFDEKVMRPSNHACTNNENRGCDENRPYTWSDFTIGKILSCMEYLGHTVNFKTQKPSFKSKKYIVNSPDEWLVFENTHTAIIDDETFATVQKLRGTKRRRNTYDEVNPLTGLLFCGECGSKLHNNRKRGFMRVKLGKEQWQPPTDDYHCSAYTYGRHAFEENCTIHHIRTEVVTALILSAIQRTTAYPRAWHGEC